MARRRPSSGGGAAALAKYFLLVWAVALGALVVLHERSLADEVRRDWAAVEGEVRRDWAAVEGEVRKEWAVVEGAVEREAHYLLDGMKVPPPLLGLRRAMLFYDCCADEGLIGAAQLVAHFDL